MQIPTHHKSAGLSSPICQRKPHLLNCLQEPGMTCKAQEATAEDQIPLCMRRTLRWKRRFGLTTRGDPALRACSWHYTGIGYTCSKTGHLRGSTGPACHCQESAQNHCTGGAVSIQKREPVGCRSLILNFVRHLNWPGRQTRRPFATLRSLPGACPARF